MNVCEGLLVLLLLILGCYVISTDISKGIVENRALLIAGLAGVIINGFYYCMFARPFLFIYLLNLLFVAILSILLYVRHYWAAGDSKLLICMTILIPGRVYDSSVLQIPGMNYLIIIFLVAYIYVVIESIVAWIKKDPSYRRNQPSGKNIAGIIWSYMMMFCLLTSASMLWNLVFREFYRENQMVFTLINILMVTMLADTSVFKSKYIRIILCGVFAILLVFRRETLLLRPDLLIRSYLIIFFALILRYFVSGYNYTEINTQDVSAGMVLAFSTIVLFQNSTVKGLPHSTTEDMSDRISEEEAMAIRRWGQSKKGRANIIIVRKIPFAIFIVIGIVLYIMIRMVL